MPNKLGEILIKVAEDYHANKEGFQDFFEYYANYLGDVFYYEHLVVKDISNLMNEQLERIDSTQPVFEQNKTIDDIGIVIKNYFVEQKLVKNESSFDALYFLALTTLGRMRNNDDE